MSFWSEHYKAAACWDVLSDITLDQIHQMCGAMDVPRTGRVEGWGGAPVPACQACKPAPLPGRFDAPSQHRPLRFRIVSENLIRASINSWENPSARTFCCLVKSNKRRDAVQQMLCEAGNGICQLICDFFFFIFGRVVHLGARPFSGISAHGHDFHDDLHISAHLLPMLVCCQCKGAAKICCCAYDLSISDERWSMDTWGHRHFSEKKGMWVVKLNLQKLGSSCWFLCFFHMWITNNTSASICRSNHI